MTGNMESVRIYLATQRYEDVEKIHKVELRDGYWFLERIEVSGMEPKIVKVYNANAVMVIEPRYKEEKDEKSNAT